MKKLKKTQKRTQKKADRINQKIDPNLLQKRRENVKGFKHKMDSERNVAEILADFLTESFGTILFLGLNALWFAIWIPINLNWIPGIPAFDPYPFGLLTTIVSLEAIFLAIIVLISQNRETKIADLREEIDLQINTLSEQKITKIIKMVDKIHDHLGLDREEDEELLLMKQNEDIEEIKELLLEEKKHNNE